MFQQSQHQSFLGIMSNRSEVWLHCAAVAVVCGIQLPSTAPSEQHTNSTAPAAIQQLQAILRSGMPCFVDPFAVLFVCVLVCYFAGQTALSQRIVFARCESVRCDAFDDAAVVSFMVSPILTALSNSTPIESQRFSANPLFQPTLVFAHEEALS